MIRRLLFAVGGGCTALGIGALVVPSTPDAGPLALVGALLVVGTIGVALSIGRLSTRRERPTPAGGEQPATVPGEAFDECLRSIPAYSDRGADRRAAVRERLRAVAVDRIVADTGCSPETAHERLDSGSWTDDPVAAALFTDAPSSTRAQVRSLLGGPSAFERRVDRAVAVLSEGVGDA